MQHLFCGGSGGTDNQLKPKKAKRHRRTATTLLSDSKSVYGRERMAEDKVTLLTSEHVSSETCQTEWSEHQKSAKAKEPSHSRHKSLNIQIMSNRRKQVVMRFILESLLGDQTVMI